MSWFTKQVTVLNQELDALERLVRQVGMTMGELQRKKVEAGENIQGADDVLTKALKLISNAEDSLYIASSYISKFNQYYKLEDAQKYWADTNSNSEEEDLGSACDEVDWDEIDYEED